MIKDGFKFNANCEWCLKRMVDETVYSYYGKPYHYDCWIKMMDEARSIKECENEAEGLYYGE